MNKFKTVSFKIVRLVFGLFLFGLGTVCILNAAIGVAPWDVFHQGISNVTGITVGRANIYSGAIIIIIDILGAGHRLGLHSQYVFNRNLYRFIDVL